MDEPSVDDRLCLALHAAARAMDAVYRPLLAGSGLTYPQYLVMSLLWEDGSQGVGALAERLSLDPSTLSPLLQRLETRGLLHRVRDDADQRKVSVVLTEAGVELHDTLRHVTDAVCGAAALTAPAEADLVRRLHSLAATLNASVGASVATSAGSSRAG